MLCLKTRCQEFQRNTRNVLGKIRGLINDCPNQQRFSRESVKFKQQRQQSIVKPNINALRKQMEQSSGFKNRRISREMQQEQHLDLGFLTQRQGGAAMVQRESVRGN